MRSKWVDVNLDEYDYLIARVEALVGYVERLSFENLELKKQLKLIEDFDRKEVPQRVQAYPVPSVLVRSL